MSSCSNDQRAVVRDPSIGETPRGLRGFLGGSLPPTFLTDATKRLRMVALVTIGLIVVGMFLSVVVLPALNLDVPHLRKDSFPGFGLLIIVSSIALISLSRKKQDSPQFLLDVGLLYSILIALAIGVSGNWMGLDLLGKKGVTFVGVWVLIYSMIVPSTPLRTWAAAFVAASMEYVGMAVAVARGFEQPPLALMVLANIPNYMMAVVAGIPALIVHRLCCQVKRAQEMGSYHLEKLLGRGGMGEVWLARHRMLARPAAIKLIRSEMLGAKSNQAAQTALKRFEREAQATAALHSPHTVKLYDFGMTRDGAFYYVMELLEGMDMESLVERYGPMPADRVVHLLRQSCHSLADAHESGLIHRDVKPANIYVCRMGIDVDFIKVLDFGLVKSEGGPAAGRQMLTAADVTTGTPAFISPEAATGEVEVGPQSDLYSLGCVAYWLLTGTLVFTGDSPVNVILKHVREKPVPPFATY